MINEASFLADAGNVFSLNRFFDIRSEKPFVGVRPMGCSWLAYGKCREFYSLLNLNIE